MNKIIKRFLAVVIAVSFVMSTFVCSYAESLNYEGTIWTDEQGALSYFSNTKGNNNFTAFVKAGQYIFLDIENYTKKKLPIIIDGTKYDCGAADSYYFSPYEDSYVSFIGEKNKVNIVCKWVSEMVEKTPAATSNDDALAQYYAALEKQQKKANKDTKDSKAELSQEELLAQYYAALEKQQKKK